MLRRIGIAVRWSLLVLGVAALVLLPVSFFVLPMVSMMLPRDAMLIYVADGALQIAHLTSHDYDSLGSPSSWDVIVHERPTMPINWKRAFWPNWQSMEYGISDYAPQTWRILTIPLWMIAAGCLAWPVLSWRAARRRGKRGFDVALVDDAPRLHDARGEG